MENGDETLSQARTSGGRHKAKITELSQHADGPCGRKRTNHGADCPSHIPVLHSARHLNTPNSRKKSPAHRNSVMPEALEEVIQFLQESEVVLVVVGAGLSRPSGLPTFREDPGFWGHPIEEIATKGAFHRNPAEVWNLYERMRRLTLDATPNEGHLALARLSKAKPSCLTITQNIDGE